MGALVKYSMVENKHTLIQRSIQGLHMTLQGKLVLLQSRLSRAELFAYHPLPHQSNKRFKSFISRKVAQNNSAHGPIRISTNCPVYISSNNAYIQIRGIYSTGQKLCQHVNIPIW